MRLLSLLFILFSINLYAQVSSSGTASVIVIRPLSIEALNPNLDFGDIILTGSQFTVSIIPLNGAEFKITGQPARDIIITFNTITLGNSNWVSIYGGTAGQIQFTPQVTKDDGSGITSGNSYQLSGTSGILSIFLGGTINIAANQPSGDYTGTFLINVSY